jgi:hypothetical protein
MTKVNKQLSPLARTMLWIAVCGIMSLIIVVVLGSPQNVAAAIAMALPLMAAVVAGSVQKKSVRRAICLFIPLTYVYLFYPWESFYYHDLRSDRHGVKIYPELLFGKDGKNSELIRRFLGYHSPEWQYGCIRSFAFGFGDWRDGNERVDSCSLIHQDCLSQLLEKLPDENARAEVLHCITNSKNLLRVHQGLLLSCIYQLGYPNGHTSESWWKKHSSLFMSTEDAVAAASMVAGWRIRIEKSLPENVWEKYWVIGQQLRAARYAEGGVWGGDKSFSNAYDELNIQAWCEGKKHANRGLKNVDWWPEILGPHYEE